MQASYPLNFDQAPVSQLQTSDSYKKQVVKVFLSILAFFVVYILLILAAIALAVGCVYAAGFIIMLRPSFITISIGVGFLLLALSVFIFLVKFIFSSTKNVNQLRVQVKEKEQPELFAYIRQISKETQTPFPKKIFISPEVNACVFYNSSFWSMIFPVRKNLELGLGLVNVLNLSEFKAVIAHEFGHFSQRSMKLGSFTYNLNQVIYNMLYNNRSYGNFLNSWASLGNVATFFASITVKIAEAIQWILKEMYQLINKNYMSLSREMEYHADAVAASVAGGNNLVSALARIDVADHCYQEVLNSADSWIKEKKLAKNLFSNQRFVLKDAKKKWNISSRINYKDQWASHPSFEDRKAHLEKLSMDSAPVEESAWTVFCEPEVLQQQMTAKLYQNVTMERSEWMECDAVHFEKWYTEENLKFELPAVYNGYYDNRFISIENWDIEELGKEKTALSFDQLFSEEHANLERSIQSCTRDIAILEAIQNKQLAISSFDFEGEKYNAAYADYLLPKMQEELKTWQDKQSELDKSAFLYFLYHPGQKNDIKKDYVLFKELSSECSLFNNLAQKIFETVAPLYQQGNTVRFVVESMDRLKMDLEPRLKKLLLHYINTPLYSNEMSSEVKERIVAYGRNKYSYYSNDQFHNEELEDLQFVINAVSVLLTSIKFNAYKKMLTRQLEVFN